ncbi:MAG TPA: twin-arginine translocase subunit TatC [Holophagaceae bacterium]|nr:twin-arginine translocase subunit TatC [Holophagaceae bacterium]
MGLPETPPDQMSFWEHLQELRVRLTRILMGVAVAFAVTYYFRFKLWAVVQQPIGGAIQRQTGKTLAELQPFAFHDLTEPFFSLMRLSLWAAAFLAAPVVFAQIWAFIRPGLLPRERRFAIPFVLVTSACFIGGATFAHFQAFKFLADILFQEALSANLRPMLSIDSALDLYLGTVLMTGLMFELPVLFFFLAKLKLVTAKWMLKYWRHATVAIVIFSAFFTPGDVIATTVFFSVILLALYFVSVIVVWVAQPKQPRPDSEL